MNACRRRRGEPGLGRRDAAHRREQDRIEADSGAEADRDVAGRTSTRKYPSTASWRGAGGRPPWPEPRDSGGLIPNRITSRSDRRSDEPPQITIEGRYAI